MSTREVDDRSTEIAYSRPLQGGHWSTHGSSESFGNTLSLTRTRGATARITFEGTRIQVYGLMSPRGTGNAPASTYGLDNREAYRFTGTQDGSNTTPRALFYDSGGLDAGTHTLIVTNDVEGSFFWLDSFVITSNPEPVPVPETPLDMPPASSASPPVASVTADPDPPFATTSSQSRPSTSGLGNEPSSTTSRSRTSSTVRSEPSASLSDFDKVVISTRGSTPSGGPGSPQVTSGVGDAPASSKQGPDVGAIVGGILGGIIVLLLFLLAFLFWRKRKGSKSPVHLAYSAPQAALAPAGSPPSDINPFYLHSSQQPVYLKTPAYSESPSMSSPSPHETGSLASSNQRHYIGSMPRMAYAPSSPNGNQTPSDMSGFRSIPTSPTGSPSEVVSEKSHYIAGAGSSMYTSDSVGASRSGHQPQLSMSSIAPSSSTAAEVAYGFASIPEEAPPPSYQQARLLPAPGGPMQAATPPAP